MRHPLVTTLIAASLLMVSAPLRAAESREALLTPASWLLKHIDDPGLVLLHVGPPGEYDARHLPGARLVSLADLSAPHDAGSALSLEMPAPESLRAALARLGISNDSRIVVYFAQGWISPATRVVFTLDYAGLGARTSLLDGGLDEWVRAGGAVTSTAPAARSGTLTPLQPRSLIVDADYVLQNARKGGTAVVDGRLAAFYSGAQTGGGSSKPHKTGHIAGARSVPFNELFTDQQVLRPAGELQAAFTKAGVKPGDTVITYCHIGQQATAVLFAARTLGYDVRLYDGSFEDWSRRNLPVELPGK